MLLSTSEVSTTSVPVGSLDPHFAMSRAIFCFYYSTDTKPDLLEALPPVLSALMIRRLQFFMYALCCKGQLLGNQGETPAVICKGATFSDLLQCIYECCRKRR